MSSTDQGGGSGAQTYLDQEARSTLTTLNRGSRSTWMFKAKPSGQAGPQIRHGFCGHRNTSFNLDSHVVAVAEKMLASIVSAG